MTPNIPIPTDSLYKFMATFGLALIVASLLATVFVVDRANHKIVEAATELFELQRGAQPVPEDWKKGVEKRIDVAVSDRSAFTVILALFGGIGVVLALVGFNLWWKIQPLHDELLELQVKKARLELYGSIEAPGKAAPMKAQKSDS